MAEEERRKETRPVKVKSCYNGEFERRREEGRKKILRSFVVSTCVILFLLLLQSKFEPSVKKAEEAVLIPQIDPAMREKEIERRVDPP